MNDTSNKASDPRVSDLMDEGTIRCALFLPQFTTDPATGELIGHATRHAAVEMTRALARRLGIEPQPVGYPSPAEATQALLSGDCDVAMLASVASCLNCSMGAARWCQLRLDERHTKPMIFLVALMSRQNRKRLRPCCDFGATGH